MSSEFLVNVLIWGLRALPVLALFLAAWIVRGILIHKGLTKAEAEKRQSAVNFLRENSPSLWDSQKFPPVIQTPDVSSHRAILSQSSAKLVLKSMGVYEIMEKTQHPVRLEEEHA